MANCAACGRAVVPSDEISTLRSDAGSFHLACAPNELVERASEEYRAILRKGVRYFVDKYAGFPSPTADLGGQFGDLGRAVEGERERRARSPGSPPSSGDART
jgi:hypothetical protein